MSALSALRFPACVRFFYLALTLLLLSCGGGGGGGSNSGSASSPALPSIPAGNNVARVVVDIGPAGASGNINIPFVTVTVCSPGTTNCLTVDHVLLDTGSTGLRIIDPGVLNNSLTLPAVTNASGDPVSECLRFVDGRFVYGSVRYADIKIAGETASSLPIQIIGDTTAPFNTVPADCIGTNASSVAALGAKGVLGVGLFAQDCGALCVGQAVPHYYYACTGGTCSATALALDKQVSNPVTAFAVDNNGLSITLPAVPITGVTSLYGWVTFGIGTQSNNGLGTATVYATNAQGDFNTTYKGTLYPSSFIDSGSNALFFEDTGIAKCASTPDFYCPPSPLALTAENAGSSGTPSAPINFTIVNLEGLSGAMTAVLSGGPSVTSGFDWGLPFFFGRSVFFAIEGASTPGGTGPYVAY